jgi:hypothetical protein
MKVSTVTEVIDHDPVVNVFSTAEKAKKFFAAVVKENGMEIESDEAAAQQVAKSDGYAVVMELDIKVL